MVCTFFGHRDCPADIMPELEAVIEDLINHKSVNTFMSATTVIMICM